MHVKEGGWVRLLNTSQRVSGSETLKVCVLFCIFRLFNFAIILLLLVFKLAQKYRTITKE